MVIVSILIQYLRYLAADLASLWTISKKSWLRNNSFCFWCPSTASDSGDFEYWKRFTGDLAKVFGIPSDRIIFCTLHAMLRVTERLLLWLLNRSRQLNTFEDVIEFIREEAEWESFCVEEKSNGNIRVGGWISLAKIGRVMKVRNQLIDVAFNPSKQKKIPKKVGPVPPKSSQINLAKLELFLEDEYSQMELPPTRPENATSQSKMETTPTNSCKETQEDNFDDSILVEELEAFPLAKNSGYASATSSKFKELFDDWAVLMSMMDGRWVTNHYVACYQSVVKKFELDMRAIFGDDTSSFVTPYIHIICSHSVKLMALALQSTRI
jgi:hypothetical protein